MIDDLFSNPDPVDYETVISTLGEYKLDLSLPYTGMSWLNSVGENADISDAIVLDVGCGNMPKLAEVIKCKHYIGIDAVIATGPNAYKKTSINGECTVDEYSDRITLVRGDMLCALSMVRDDSVSIIMNAIDNIVLNDNELYARAVANEIMRVTKPGGSVTGFNSYPLNFIKGFQGFLDKQPKGAWAELVKPLDY